MAEDHVLIPTAAGIMPGFAAWPEGAPRAAVVLYMDAPGFRPELQDMARRIAGQGYFCLLPDFYYRDGEVRFDFAEKPGVSNLLSILGAATDRDPAALADSYEQYGQLKVDTADAVVAMLEPLQARFRELESDPAETARLLALGADKARSIAAPVVERAKTNIGLLAG